MSRLLASDRPVAFVAAAVAVVGLAADAAVVEI